jgi:hypothetical protein
MTISRAGTANRGPIEYSAISPAVTFNPPIQWIQVATAGSGGLVVKDEGGTSRTYTGLLAGQVLAGPFSEITSMTTSKILVGDGHAPEVSPPLALAQLYTSAQTTQGLVALMPQSFYLLTGAPLAIFANGASAVPGSAIVDSKAFAIRWNNNSTLNGVMTAFAVPPDLDITANVTLTIYASKTGATSGDACTFDVGAFNQVVGALHDADTDFGGTTTAMTGAATAKTIQAVTLTLALANLAASPASVTLTIKPTDGTLGTDDLCLLGVRLSYTRKLLSS